MLCSDAKQRLQQAFADETTGQLDGPLRDHLHTCASCRDDWQELTLTRLLATSEVPPMSTGFADQALAQAWDKAHPAAVERSSGPRHTGAWIGLAASLLLGCLVWSYTTQRQPVTPPAVAGANHSAPAATSESAVVAHATSSSTEVATVAAQPTAVADAVPVVRVVPQVARQVQIRLVSKEALPDARISIRLEGNLALTGYPGKTAIAWKTAIAAGTNQLALPINLATAQLATADQGTVIIEVRSGRASKRWQFAVQAEQANAQRSNPVYLASL